MTTRVKSGGISDEAVTSAKIADNSIAISDISGGSNLLQGRNRIINGDMRIDQRNAGAAVSVNGAENVYTIDRWASGAIGGGAFSVQQSSTAPPGFSKSLSVTVTATDTSLATDDRYSIYQYIEGYNMADLAFGSADAKTVTISFKVRSSVTGSFGVYMANSSFNRSIVTTFTIDSADTWETKTVTFTGDVTGTWQTTNLTGIVLGIVLSTGTLYQGTADTWTASAKFTTSSQTNFMATNGATFYITGVQLEVGSIATNFERVDYSEMLRRCQRYYFKFNNSAGSAWANNNFTASGFRFPVTMRAQPSIDAGATFSANVGSAGTVTVFTGSPTGTDGNSIWLYNSASNWTVGAVVALNAGFSAEL